MGKRGGGGGQVWVGGTGEHHDTCYVLTTATCIALHT